MVGRTGGIGGRLAPEYKTTNLFNRQSAVEESIVPAEPTLNPFVSDSRAISRLHSVTSIADHDFLWFRTAMASTNCEGAKWA